ncbi:serine O-acetyltransferase [Actinokineospora guangxiensis]|uniref:Serine acetyltransferase n=1 Tax=Actinokineospora guangxiensis TaxID=1490288 RepID=A0ABW0EKW9_9PSEU
MRVWQADLRAATGRDRVGPVRAVWLLLTRPGVLAVALLRLQQRAPLPLAHLLRSLCHLLTGADFVPGARVGPGLRLEHPSGLVVGAGAVVGADAFLCQRVTLGERLGGRGPAYPVLGDGVFVGANATLLGGVRVGSGARIGAGAVVLTDVPAGATAVGNPARVLRPHATSTALYGSTPGTARSR